MATDRSHIEDLSPQEMRTLLVLAKRVLWASKTVRQSLQIHGINITPASFYSNIPLVSDIEESFEYKQEASGSAPYEGAGLFDRERIRDFVESIAAFAAEFDPPLEGDAADPDGFFWKNPAFSFLDAMSYYCILRMIKPARVLEVGSGHSTLVADQALRKNGSGELIVIEPYPKAFLHTLPTVSRLIERPVQTIPEQELVELVDSCQIWFIDSTHTVKTGSDCLYLYLKVMPRITSPVLCHSHDVYLPYAMPAVLALDKHVYWTEQYLLLAYLLDNPKVKIVAGSCYLHRQMSEQSKALMHGRYSDGGSSLWYWINPATTDAR
jgi:hypothetical protein